MAVNDLLDKEERPSYVRFEVRAVKDPEASLASGRYVSKDVDYVLVSALGSRDTFTKRADKWFIEAQKSVDRGRVPIKHLELYREIYHRWKKGLEPPVDGTSVKDWNALSPAQCENMLKYGIRTVEDMAQATDEALRYLGAGAVDLRNKAKAWLQAGSDHGPLIEEVAKLKKENVQLKGSIDSLQEKIKRFEVQSDAQKEYDPMDHSPQTISPVDIPEISAREQYQAKFGKLPHHRMKDETILKALQE